MFVNTRGSLRSFKQHAKAELQLLFGFFKFMVASFFYDVLVFTRDPFALRQRLSSLFAPPPAYTTSLPPVPERRHASRQFQVFEAVLLPDEQGQLVNVLFNKRDNRWELNPSMCEGFSTRLDKTADREKVLLLCSKKLVHMLAMGVHGDSMLTVDDAENGRVDTYRTAVTQLPRGHDYRGKRGELLSELPLSSHDIFHIENLKHYLLHAYSDLEAAVHANAGAFMGTWLITVPQLLNIINDPAAHVACKTAFWDLNRLGFASTIYLRPEDCQFGAMDNARASGDMVTGKVADTTRLSSPDASFMLRPELMAAVVFLTTPPPGDLSRPPTLCPRIHIVSGTMKGRPNRRNSSGSVVSSVGSLAELEEVDLPTRSPWVWARKAYERDVSAPQARADTPSTALESSPGQALPMTLTSDIRNSSAAFLAGTPPKCDLSDLENWIDDDKTPTRPVHAGSGLFRNTSTEAVASFDMNDSGDETPTSTLAHQGSTPGRPASDVSADQSDRLTVPTFSQSSRISSVSSMSTVSHKSRLETHGHVSPVSSVSPVLSTSDCAPVVLTIPGSSLVVRSTSQSAALEVATDHVHNTNHVDQELSAVGGCFDGSATVDGRGEGNAVAVDRHSNAFHIGSFVEGCYLAGKDTKFRSLSDSERSRSNTATSTILGEIDVPDTCVLTGDITPSKKKSKGNSLNVEGETEAVGQSPIYSGMYSGRKSSSRRGKFKPNRGGARG